MKKHLIICSFLAVHLHVSAEEPRMVPALFATESKIVRFNKEGEITWQVESGVARDVWQLSNGNVLFPFNFKPGLAGGVREVTPEGKVVWEFKTKGWVLSCQRLPNGSTLVGASSRCALLIVNPTGEIINEIKVKSTRPHKHSLTMARQLENGNFLVAEESSSLVREYSPDGKVAWEIQTPFRPFSVIRADNGNTFFSGKDGIIEVNPAKEIVWQLTKKDVANMGPRWFAGIQIRANGNIMVCNAGGKVPFYEVNRDKKVVWQASMTRKEAEAGHSIFLLDEKPPYKR